MSNCQECGSDVAEQDTFCPFCGISLQPASIAPSTADSFERTIAMQIPPAPVILSEELSAPEPEPEDTPGNELVPASEREAEPAEPVETLGEPAESAEEVTAPPDQQTRTEEEVLPAADETVHDSESVIAEVPSSVVEEPPSAVIEEVPSPEAESHSEPGTVDTEPDFESASLLSEQNKEDNLSPSLAAVDGEAHLETPESLVIEELAGPIDTEDRSARSEETLTPAVEPEPGFELAAVDAVIGYPADDAEPEQHDVVPDLESSTERAPDSPEPDKEKKAESTSSGDISEDEQKSMTSPNLEGSTDGRKSGLKPLSAGTLLNSRYEIVKKIGGGGMGAVYLAIDQNLGGTQRAVKEMVQSHIEEEQQAKAIEDFKRESMILSALDHPSIPTIYDYFYDEKESRFYLVMKYISGGDLAARLRSAPEGRIDERAVTEWALQVIDVLHYLHSLPSTIVYRDLKPSNVMIDGNTGRVMLIDFGIARSINKTLEKGVTAVGTMGYAPPELFSGQVEPRSDIYSLGSTMFHLLTGADPQNNPLLIFDFQKNPRPRQINPRLSDQIERILMRAVEYNADARFTSALEMKLALQQHLEDLRNGRVTYGISEVPAAVSLANQNVFCGFCGQRIVATDMFCAFCGSKQPLAQQGVHSEIYGARAVSTARLVIDGTSELAAPAYALEKNDNLIGRRDPTSNIFPEVDLSKYDPQTKISRRHARVWREGSSFLVEDLGSSNGTLLLSTVSDALRLVPHQPHPLANGDRIRVGDTTLQFIVG